MLEVAEAQGRIWSAFQALPGEWVSLELASGRVLANDVVAMRTQPPCAMSAMDGFAVRAIDTENDEPLRLIGESRAGAPFSGSIGPGEAVRIYTGAAVPSGADAILIQENAQFDPPTVVVKESVVSGQFVRRQGLDFETGQIGIERGTLLDARHIGLAASMGNTKLCVHRKPHVGIIATGDELHHPGEPLGPGDIISSNTPSLTAMVQAWGGRATDFGIVADNSAALVAALESAKHCDLIVTTGGASVGDFDLVQSATAQAGMALDFWKIRMRPGKPLIFGKLFDKPFLGLPGNPVSAAVCALVFMRGALKKMLAGDPALPMSSAMLEHPLPANDTRQDYIRGNFSDPDKTIVTSADRQDSSMFATFANADVLIVRPPFAPPVAAGERVDIVELPTVLGTRS